ncbi:MAG: excinuclease ABC subunit UvrC [Gammaproteobacteria bacterium]
MTEQGSFDAPAFVRSLPNRPGVYRMLDAQAVVLYVGKARDLKKRVASYFRMTGLSDKTQALMTQMATMEYTVTHTENEALILEFHLIKEHKPRYNILLRDDKSYPYLYLSQDTFPRLALHRGPQRATGRYFGPFPSAWAVRDSLNLMQKLFRVRQCEDSFFRARSRPCLQYQIKRCTGPCVGLIDKAAYQRDVRNAVLFLEGRSNQVIDEWVQHMETAAAALDYEQAALYRDQIASLRRVQERQYVSGEGGDLDIIACVARNGIGCVQVFFIRAGRNLGNKTFFPDGADMETAETLNAFLSQYYLNRDVPAELLVNEVPEDADLLARALSEQAQRTVTITNRVRGERARWLAMAVANAEQALDARLSSRAGMTQRLQALQDALELPERPARMECFDISHTMGEATVASCVVFDAEGPRKSDYRRFNIEGVEAGDDYGALRQALTRRYTRLKQGEARLPDILFIDGGRGQVSVVQQVLDELQLNDQVLVGIAKGAERRPGLERLFLPGREAPLILPAHSPALHLIQQIRDEAHRFAITAHRQRRGRARTTSVLEEIPGMGPKRRQQLLKQFGGLREVARAGVEDLAKVKGISKQLAQQIYDALRGDRN